MLRHPRPAALALGLATVLALSLPASPARALEECRLLRQPDIAGDRIVFVYGGDLWLVGRGGGNAQRLTTHEGVERFPKFSPDGLTIAFTGEYDGNVDAYTIPVAGGEPARLTWHPDADQVAEWYPDGSAILLRSLRMNRAARRPDRFFKVPAKGGLVEPLPLTYAGYASFAPDGRSLAFVSPSYDNRTWKRYRGGNSPEIWVYDFTSNSSQNITSWAGPDEWPMWWQRSVYFVSDRGGRVANLWAYDLDAKTSRQVTSFTEYDVKWPSIGGSTIVFENGGYLYVLELPNGQPQRIQVLVPDDKPASRPAWRNVAAWASNADLSPSGKRAVIEARGDLFTVPAEFGEARNLTRSNGVRERDPAWSPDGRWVAYVSDRTGEAELWVAGADGKTPEKQVTKRGRDYPFAPVWSPDSKKLAWADNTGSLQFVDVAGGKVTTVDKSDYGDMGGFAWSPDSKWLAYANPQGNNADALFLYGLASGQKTKLSTGMFHDFSPAFDPDGRYLWFLSRRRADLPTFAFEVNFPGAASDRVFAVTLRDSVPSPLQPRSDEETGEAVEDGGGKDAGAPPDAEKGKGKADKSGKAEKPAAAQDLRVDLAGIERRVLELDVPWGRYAGLMAFKDKLLFLSLDPPDPDADGPSGGTLRMYDLKKREMKTVIGGIRPGYATTKDGGKVLYRAQGGGGGMSAAEGMAPGGWGIVDAAEGKKPGDGRLKQADNLQMDLDPRAEWLEMFNEAWRLERDFYYDPAMGGLDWDAVGERYRQLIPYVAHRSDLNYVLGEMLGELSTSHAYVGGGDAPQPHRVSVGLLGADYELDAASGRYRFKTLYTERDWNGNDVAPLGVPGVIVKPGEYLLQVDGRDLKAPENLYSAFEGTAGRAIPITVGASPNDPKPRTYVVTPVASEFQLRYRAWVAANRQKVLDATGGKCAYIHLPNTQMAGVEEFTKQFYPQVDRQALIVDERWNGGGFIPDFFVERLQRKTIAYWSRRDADDFKTPTAALDGPKTMLINQYAGSGGDALPHYFRLAGLGPLIGKRTWGGLVGISRNLPLVDGGVVTIPDFGMWSPRDGKWEIENHGVDPDIEIEDRPEDGVAGRDPQLDRAIQYINEQLKTHPPQKPPRPGYKIQEGLKK